MMDPSDQISRLRQALVAPPDEATTRRHLDAMQRAAAGLPSAARRGLTRALLVAASVAAIAASLPLAVPREALPGGILRSTSTAASRIVECASHACSRAECAVPGSGPAGAKGSDAPTVEPAEGSNDHGEQVSDTARTTDERGREKGKEVSDEASSKSQEHRKNGDKRPESNPAGIAPGAGEPAGGKPDAPPAGDRGKGKG